MMKRCKSCILPENYAGIRFNEDGVCNYCTSHKPRSYRGDEALKEAVLSFKPYQMEPNENFDCIVALSGGRDSSYLLYHMAKGLNLRVMAYCVDNGFMPQQTRENIERMVKILGVKLVVEQKPLLKQCVQHHIKAWMAKPNAAMVGMFCTGCRFDIDDGLAHFARKTRIPVIVSGSTPLEGGWYKRNLIKLDPNSSKPSSFVLGYIKQILQNPKWITSPTCMKTQMREYMIHFRNKKPKKDVLTIGAFYNYLHWKEEVVVSTIENELQWKKRTNSQSTWRGDCDVALLKLYMYKKFLGFNDKDDGLSCLIRDKQLTRDEALKRIEDEGTVPDSVVKEIIEGMGLKYATLQKKLAMYES